MQYTRSPSLLQPCKEVAWSNFQSVPNLALNGSCIEHSVTGTIVLIARYDHTSSFDAGQTTYSMETILVKTVKTYSKPSNINHAIMFPYIAHPDNAHLLHPYTIPGAL